MPELWTVANWLTFGNGAGEMAILNMYDGTLNAGRLTIGRLGSTGLLNMTGGTLNLSNTLPVYELRIAPVSGDTGHVQLDGGIINVAHDYGFVFGPDATMDIAGGTLVLGGDVNSLPNGVIANGGDPNWVLYFDYNEVENMTTITAFFAPPTETPVITPPDNLLAFEGKEYSEKPSAQMGAVPIEYWTKLQPSAANEPNNFVFDANDGNITWTPEFGEPNLVVEMTATNYMLGDPGDPCTSDPCQWTITVKHATEVPVIVPPADLGVFVGEQYSEMPTVQWAATPVTTWDLNEPAAGSEPSNFVFDANTGNITWTPDVGAVDLTVKMTAENSVGTSDPCMWVIKILRPPTEHWWTGLGDGSSWGDSDNWDGDDVAGTPYVPSLPTAADATRIGMSRLCYRRERGYRRHSCGL